MCNCFKRVEVDLETEIEIVNSGFSYLKPKRKVILQKDIHDLVAVIIESEKWHSEHIRLISIVDYRQSWNERQ